MKAGGILGFVTKVSYHYAAIDIADGAIFIVQIGSV
jgi:hypothetical protein